MRKITTNRALFWCLLCLLTAFAWAPAGIDFQFEINGTAPPVEVPEVPRFLSHDRPASVQHDGWVLVGSATSLANRTESGDMWIKRGPDGQVFLSRHYKVHDTRNRSTWALSLDVDVTVETESGAPGQSLEDPVPPARVTAWFSDGLGNRLTRTTLMRLPDNDIRSFVSQILPIPHSASQLNVTIHTWKNTFKLTVNSLSVTLLKPTIAYRLYLFMLTSGWLLITILIIRILYQQLSAQKLILFLLSTALLLFGITLSDEINSNIVLPLYRKVSLLAFKQSPEDSFYLYKSGHAIVFFMLGTLALGASRQLQRSKLEIVLILVALAIATEGLQLNFIHRTPRWQDILVDLAGVAAGLIVIWIMGRGQSGNNQTSGKV